MEGVGEEDLQCQRNSSAILGEGKVGTNNGEKINDALS